MSHQLLYRSAHGTNIILGIISFHSDYHLLVKNRQIFMDLASKQVPYNWFAAYQTHLGILNVFTYTMQSPVKLQQ